MATLRSWTWHKGSTLDMVGGLEIFLFNSWMERLLNFGLSVFFCASLVILLLSNSPVALQFLMQAVIAEEKTKVGASEASTANLQVFPPTNGSYQAPGTPYGGDEQTTSNWKGFFSVSSYTPYFNVDTDIVVDRIISSVYPMNDFSRKTDSNPDLYGPIWISTTLIFMLAAFGNCASYLMHKRNHPNDSWNFDVNYVDWAACVIYGYVLAVPAAFYFLLQYFGFSSSLVRLWCMWGYSLFIFIPTSLLLVIPVEILRWIIILLAGSASSWFIALNLKASVEGSDIMVLVVSALLLQFVLALLIKIFFFA